MLYLQQNEWDKARLNDHAYNGGFRFCRWSGAAHNDREPKNLSREYALRTREASLPTQIPRGSPPYFHVFIPIYSQYDGQRRNGDRKSRTTSSFVGRKGVLVTPKVVHPETEVGFQVGLTGEK